MNPNLVKQILQAGTPTCGSWVSLCSPIGAEVMGQLGFDWLLIDMEHGAGDYQTLMAQLQALNASTVVPFVRVVGPDPAVIKRVLDLGALGVMIPGVRTLEEAQLAIAACKYPPQGTRGVASVRAARYGQDRNYLKQANNNVMVILQIETKEALDDLERILDLPGIDVVFVGPADLSASLGHLGDAGHAEVLQAIEKIDAAAKARNLPLGSVSVSWEAARALLDKGYTLVSIMSDVRFLMQAAGGAVASFIEATGRKSPAL